MPKHILLAGSAFLALTASAAQAQQVEEVELEPVVVTANRKPTEQGKVGSKVEKVDKKEIEEKSRPLVLDYLSLLPGVAISSTGGPGSDGSLAIRGLPRRYVKTLFNGIDISDPTQTQVQTAYEYLLTGGLDNIEVLKGAQSTLYGSDAIGGVISLSTLGGIEPGIHNELDLEAGSFGTFRTRYGLKAANERVRMALNLGGLTTDGISAAASGTEDDGFRNLSFDANIEGRVNENVSVFGSALVIDGKADFDDSFPAIQDNLYNQNRMKQRAVRGGVNIDLLDGRLKNTFSAQIHESDRNLYLNSGWPYEADYIGGREKLEYQGSFEANSWLTLQYGADHERQTANFTDGGPTVDQEASNSGVWSQVLLEPVHNLALTAGLRHDEHSEYGGHTTYRLTGSYLFEQTGTRLHSSFGTGFRAPSMYELYDPFSGNDSLKPETSRSFDIGVEQRLLDERMLVDVTYFQADVDNRIDWVSDGGWGGTYEQVPGKTRSHGVEMSFAFSATNWLTLGGSYTYTRSTAEGVRTARVPEHAFILSAAAQPWERWTIGADLKYVADTVETDQSPLDDYVLVNAKIAFKPNEKTELYLRGENLLDEKYQTAKGYNMPGIAGYAGVKLRF